jgi:hypothetical protein
MCIHPTLAQQSIPHDKVLYQGFGLPTTLLDKPIASGCGNDCWMVSDFDKPELEGVAMTAGWCDTYGAAAHRATT